MERREIPELAIRSFLCHLDKVVQGETGTVSRGELSTVGELPTHDDIAKYAEHGQSLLGKVAVLKLNGGLGTTMGLDNAKSLLTVRNGQTFLDLTARQILWLRATSEQQVPLILMNSYHTDGESRRELASHVQLPLADLPLCFVQHWVPKLDAATMDPVNWPDDPELAWCPPGHGDLLITLKTTGLLERLLARMDLVTREEFDAVQAMAARAREDNEALAKRIDALEGKAAGGAKKRAPASSKKA